MRTYHHRVTRSGPDRRSPRSPIRTTLMQILDWLECLEPVEAQAFRDHVCKAIRILTYRERETIKLLYGLLDAGCYFSRDEVGRIFRVTPTEVARIEGRALAKLNDPICRRAFADILVELVLHR